MKWKDEITKDTVIKGGWFNAARSIAKPKMKSGKWGTSIVCKIKI